MHGAGSGPWVFERWHRHFDGARVETVDLHAGLEVGLASMRDYAAAIERAAAALPRPLTVIAWSMGGLAAMLAAPPVDLLVLLEPSPPGELQGFRPELALVQGTFDPERAYGAFPPGVRARPESALARAERKRGISVAALHQPTLVVYGDEFLRERGQKLARLYGAAELHLPGKTHWDLVRDEEAVAAVAQASRSTG